MSEAVYNYGRDFQIRVLSLLVQQDNFLARYQGVVKPRYFEDPDHASLCRLILEYHEQYSKPPTEAELKMLVEDSLRGATVSAGELGILLQNIHTIYHFEIGNIQFVIDKVVKFGQRQELKYGISQILDLLDSPKDEDYEQSRSILDKALRVGFDKDTGVDFSDVVEDLPHMAKKSVVYDPHRRIRTLWPTVDRSLSGGLSIGEFGILLGSKNVGKSTALANLGAAAVLMQIPVLHITLELKEIDVLLKYGSRFTGMGSREIIESNGSFSDRAKKLHLSPSTLRVKYFSPGTLTATELKSFIGYIRSAEGFQPRLLIIDYLKQMKLARDYEGYGKLVDAIIEICDEFQLATWTAHQFQRAAYKAEQADASNVGDSWQIVEKADVVISMQQTEKEKSGNVLRMSIDCARRGKDGIMNIPFNINYIGACIKEICK